MRFSHIRARGREAEASPQNGQLFMANSKEKRFVGVTMCVRVCYNHNPAIFGNNLIAFSVCNWANVGPKLNHV